MLLIYLIGIIGIIGLPVVELGSFMILACGVLMVCNSSCKSEKTYNGKRWIFFGVILLLLGLRSILPELKIEEGHNLFLKTETRDPFVGYLPPEVYNSMERQFLESYPIENQCEDGTLWCWKTKGIPNRVFAFSSDSFWQRDVRMSRWVHQIDFDNLSGLKTGFVSDYDSCFYDSVSDVKRESLPYFVTWKIHPSMLDGTLSWVGDLWIGNRQDGYRYLPGNHRIMEVDSSMLEDEIWVTRIPPGATLSVRFEPRHSLKIFRWVKQLLTLLALVCLAFAYRPINWRNVFLDFQILAASILVLWLMSPSFLTGRPILWGGGDGLWTEGFAFWGTQALKNGDILSFLRGGESAFYLMPFLRYFRTLEDLFFGDTQYLMVGFVLLIPIGVNRVFKVFTTDRIAFVLSLIFCCLPWHMGMIRWAELSIFGLSESVAFAFLLPPIIAVISKSKSPHQDWWIPLFLAFSVGLRPNYIPIAGLILSLKLLDVWREQTKFLWTFPLVFGGVILLIPLHNLIFSHRLIWLTTGYHQVKTVLWIDWIYAARDILLGPWDSEAILKIGHQLEKWIFAWPHSFWKLTETHQLKMLLGYLNILSVVSCLISLLLPKQLSSLRRLAALAIVSQAIVLLFQPTGRYAFLAWDLCYFHVVCWMLSGMELISFNYPKWIAEQISKTSSKVFLITGAFVGYLAFQLSTAEQNQLRLCVTTDHDSAVELFYADKGGFHSGQSSVARFYQDGKQWVELSFPIGTRKLRLDPSYASTGNFSIKTVRIRYGNGVPKSYDLERIEPINSVEMLSEKGSFRIVGGDPILHLTRLPEPSLIDLVVNNLIAWMILGGITSDVLFQLNRRIFEMRSDYFCNK